MSLLSSLCRKTLSTLLAIAFLAESALLPVAALLPQTARAAGPTISISPTTFAPGAAFFVTVTGLAPNGFVRVSSLNPQGGLSEFTSGTANTYGSFTKSFVTSSWTSGTYKLWADANGQSNIVSFLVTPILSLSSYNFTTGTSQTVTVSNAVPGAEVKVFCRDPNGVVCDDPNPGTADSLGKFSRAYDTTGWTVGNYSGWVTVGGTKSNTVYFAATNPSVSNNPAISVSAQSFVVGGSFVKYVSGAAPNAPVRMFSKSPSGTISEEAAGTTNASGQFSRSYVTTGWATGAYETWASVNDVKSNVATYTITASAGIVPAGYVDSVTSDDLWCGISGWAWDADAPNTPLAIKMYRDRASNDTGGALIATITADVFRQDLVAAGKGDGRHGFRYLFNASSGLSDGQPHTLSIYAIDVANPATSVRLPSSQNAVTVHPIRCSNESGYPSTMTISPNSLTEGASVTATVTNAAANAPIILSALNPDGFPVSDVAGVTDSSGKFSKTYSTSGWTTGTYKGWARINNVKSSVATYTITVPGGTWGISIDSGKAGTFPNPVVRGKPVDFLVTLTVTDPPSPLGFKMEVSKDLALRHYYITRVGEQEVALNDPTRPTATLANRNAYAWDIHNLTTGTYTLRFNFDVPLSTTDSSAQFDIFMTALHSGFGSGYQDQSFPVPALTFPSGKSVSKGTPLIVAITNAAGNTTVSTNCITQNGDMCADNLADGSTNASGQWSKSYDTSNWTVGTYRSWVNVSGLKSNLEFFTVTPAQPQSQPSLSLSAGGAQGTAISLTQGVPLVANVSGAAPNAEVRTFCTDPNGHTCADNMLIGVTNSSGSFSASFGTGTWTVSGANNPHRSYVTVNGVRSNDATFYVTSPAVQPDLSTIRGSKIDANGAAFTNPGATITVTGDDFTNAYVPSDGSYTVLQVPSGDYTISSSVPSGYTVSYSLCRNCADHPASSYTPGTSISVNTPVGGYVEVWWKYTPMTVADQPSLSLSAGSANGTTISFAKGTPLMAHVANAVPNAEVRTFCTDPNGHTCADNMLIGVTDDSGSLSASFETGAWTVSDASHPHTSYIKVNGISSNIVRFSVTPSSELPPTDGRPAPTPTTAPMATLTLERDQEQALPNQAVSFSGTLDSSKVAFPQGSTLFIAIPEKTSVERVEIDGKVLGAGEFTLSNGNAKIPFSQALYNGSHQFRIVLRNEVSLVPQLDRNIAVWVSVVGADGKLLLKGRTASTMMAHLPTEIIGKGVTLSVPGMMSGGSWSSVAFPLMASGASFVPGSFLSASNKIKFPIREFSFSETDITRGPFFTPNRTPFLPENIAFTLLPGDATMQRTGLSLKQFSDALAREFITAEYQYLIGRDPSSEEVARYLPRFTQWRNPLANLAEVYSRRTDIQQLVLVPRDKNIGGSNSGSPRPSWDKLLEWVRASGWKEEASLASFKPQSGFDNGWQLFRELWTTYAPLVGLENIDRENYDDYFMADVAKNPISAIAYLCRQSNVSHGHYPKPGEGIDFEFCWKNDQMVRNYAILWAKDQGWAYNSFVTEQTDGGDVSYTYPVVATINPSGPILASMFAPGKYQEFAEEQQWRYPPAQLYYDLIASPEYAQSIEKRFRANIDSIIRLFFGRPSTESDIAWAKDKFISGGVKKSLGYGKFYSWITPQWEPNGMLIASNFQYVDEVEFVKNPRFITDDVYGIRNIQGEIDAVSSRLIEMIEKHGRQELYQGDSFKRIVSGLYRLYLRRTPTDAEVEKYRASKKDFGDIEMDLNQSKEYSKTPASDAAIKSLYRNYLGRDPNDADIAQWGDKTISSIANKMGKSAGMKEYAQQHPENAYIFPIKHIKMVKCGFFCSIFKLRWTSLTSLIPGYGIIINMAINLGYGISGAVSGPQAAGRITSITMNSISKGFNEAGFNGETFVQRVSIARAMAGQAGGVFSMANVLENADPTILDGFRTMAVAPQASGSAFAQTNQSYPGLASPFGAIAGLFDAGQAAPTGHIAQIDVSGHYGSVGTIAPAKSAAGTATKAKFTKTLAQGSRGSEVLKLQKLLGEADLAFLPEYQTGYYGAKTVAAVKRFQKRNGLEQVGFVGAKTRMLLNSIAK